jgi:hypothetical protein
LCGLGERSNESAILSSASSPLLLLSDCLIWPKAAVFRFWKACPDSIHCLSSEKAVYLPPRAKAKWLEAYEAYLSQSIARALDVSGLGGNGGISGLMSQQAVASNPAELVYTGVDWDGPIQALDSQVPASTPPSSAAVLAQATPAEAQTLPTPTTPSTPVVPASPASPATPDVPAVPDAGSGLTIVSSGAHTTDIHPPGAAAQQFPPQLAAARTTSSPTLPRWVPSNADLDELRYVHAADHKIAKAMHPYDEVCLLALHLRLHADHVHRSCSTTASCTFIRKSSFRRRTMSSSYPALYAVRPSSELTD